MKYYHVGLLALVVCIALVVGLWFLEANPVVHDRLSADQTRELTRQHQDSPPQVLVKPEYTIIVEGDASNDETMERDTERPPGYVSWLEARRETKTREEYQPYLDRESQFYQAQLAKQPRDPAWAATQEDRVMEFLSRPGFEGVGVSDVVCATTLCSATLQFDDSETKEALMMEAGRSESPWKYQGTFIPTNTREDEYMWFASKKDVALPDFRRSFE